MQLASDGQMTAKQEMILLLIIQDAIYISNQKLIESAQTVFRGR
jgi:hypothetical protein